MAASWLIAAALTAITACSTYYAGPVVELVAVRGERTSPGVHHHVRSDKPLGRAHADHCCCERLVGLTIIGWAMDF
jgi:hypothetical protein